MHPKVTILGCGLSGMITALAFAKRGIQTDIIESLSVDDSGFANDIRTTAFTASSKKFFQDIDIWQKLESLSSPFNDIYVADNQAPEMIHFSSSDVEKGDHMGHLLENTDLKTALLALVQANLMIKIIDKTSYKIVRNSEEGCELILNGKQKHECDLLVVCDGRRSLARQQYFSSSENHLYGQHAITFVVHHDKPHEGTAVEHFMPSGPFAILPLRDQNSSSVVWTVADDKKEALMNLSADEFLYVAQQNFGEFLGEIRVKSEVSAFPLKFYETKEYYNKRIALVADTAHIMHPLAGQGLNQGIKDIESLVRSIVESNSVINALSQYQNERKEDNSHMLELTDIINSTFSNRSKIFHQARQVGFKLIEEVPVLKSLLVKYAMGKR